MGAFEIFAIVASAIALVFVSWAIFRLTRFPPGTVFIVLGFVLSLTGATVPGALTDTVKLATPILLGAVLFGCGLKINLLGAFRNPGAVGLSLLTLAGTVAVCGFAAHLLLGFGFAGSLVVGAVCASISSFFVFHIIDTVNIRGDFADSLTLESSMTEAGALLLALAAFQLSSGASAVQAAAFGLVFGLLGGIMWVRLVRFSSDFPHKDALTLSLVLAVAAFCEMVFPESGMMSALFFGLAMGNSGLLKANVGFEGLLRFQEEVIMVGGTFTFFYFGLSVSGVDVGVLFLGALLWLLSFVIRALAVRFTHSGLGLVVVGLAPKGLSALLVAMLALSQGLDPGGKLVTLMLPILVLSGIVGGVSPAMIEGKRPPKLEGLRTKERGGGMAEGEEGIRHAYDREELKKEINSG